MKNSFFFRKIKILFEAICTFESQTSNFTWKTSLTKTETDFSLVCFLILDIWYLTNFSSSGILFACQIFYSDSVLQKGSCDKLFKHVINDSGQTEKKKLSPKLHSLKKKKNVFKVFGFFKHLNSRKSRKRQNQAECNKSESRCCRASLN